MKIGTEDRKKLVVLSVAGVGALAAVVYTYSQLFGSGTPAPAAVVQPSSQAVNSSASRTTANSSSTRAGTSQSGAVLDEKRGSDTAAALDPTLHMSAMLTTEALQYKGLGRNIFSTAKVVAAALPRAIAPARPRTLPAAYTPPPGPPPPPPIDLRFFGTATSRGQQPRVFLLKGDDVFLASVGDVVQRRYKILSISANSIMVRDLVNNHQQSLPLEAN